MYISHNKPSLDEKEAEAVVKVLKTNWIISGSEVMHFEEKIRNYIGTTYAVAVNNGTAALHLSLLALDIKKGDEIILPTYTVSDILNAINYVGAKPVLIDNVKNLCLLDIEKIKEKISPKTKAMLIPHTFGFPVDIQKLRNFGIPIIEDCAQALGSTIKDRRVGSFGDVSIFSFYATKLITTGQGGMMLTNNKTIYNYIRDAIDYNGRDNYKVRYNYQLTDIAASIGNVQFEKYKIFSEKRKNIAKQYQKILEKKGLLHLPGIKDTTVIPFRFVFQCKNISHLQQIKNKFFKAGIEVLQPTRPYELLHRLLGESRQKYPYAEEFANTMLSLPIYPNLTGTEIEKILNVLSSL